jgi:hypothetical protein
LEYGEQLLLSAIFTNSAGIGVKVGARVSVGVGMRVRVGVCVRVGVSAGAEVAVLVNAGVCEGVVLVVPYIQPLDNIPTITSSTGKQAYCDFTGSLQIL